MYRRGHPRLVFNPRPTPEAPDWLSPVGAALHYLEGYARVVVRPADFGRGTGDVRRRQLEAAVAKLPARQILYRGAECYFDERGDFRARSDNWLRVLPTSLPMPKEAS